MDFKQSDSGSVRRLGQVWYVYLCQLYECAEIRADWDGKIRGFLLEKVGLLLGLPLGHFSKYRSTGHERSQRT